jgi:hypothetical protein
MPKIGSQTRRRLQARLFLKSLNAALTPVVSPNEKAREKAEAESRESAKKLLEEEAAEAKAKANAEKLALEKRKKSSITPPTSLEISTPSTVSEEAIEHNVNESVASEEEPAAAAAAGEAHEFRKEMARQFHVEISNTLERIADGSFKTLLARVNALTFDPESMNVGFALGLGMNKAKYISEQKPRITSFLKRLERMIPPVFELKRESENAQEMNRIVCDSIDKNTLFLTIKNYILPLILLFINLRGIDVEKIPTVESRKEAVVIDFGKGPSHLHMTIHTDRRLCTEGSIGAVHARDDNKTKLRRYRIDKAGFNEIEKRGKASSPEEIILMNYTMTLLRALWRNAPGGGYSRTRKIKRTH